jgi:hypothetical protein
MSSWWENDHIRGRHVEIFEMPWLLGKLELKDKKFLKDGLGKQLIASINCYKENHKHVWDMQE